MYPYSNYPNPNYPNQDPNNQGQGNVPPYSYPENPNMPPPYQPYNYQGGPQGQPPYNYYQPQPPRPHYGVHPAVRIIGIVFLVIFFLSLVGHRGFFFFPVIPLIIFAIIMLATRASRYGNGWGRSYYRRHHYNYWNNNNYPYPGQPYNYTQTPPPPGYYYGPQQQQAQSQQTQAQPGWPTPKDPYKDDMDNPY